MDIIDIKIKKEVLENEINKLVNKYQEETGTFISNISYSSIYSAIGMIQQIIKIEIKI
jgi:hypothetical protein